MEFTQKKIYKAEQYLGTAAMQATASSMALVSSVLGFEIVEIWTEAENGKLHCTYVHVEEATKQKYPEIIWGHYPLHKKEHKLSPKLCEFAKQSQNRCHWKVIENRVSAFGLGSTVYDQLSFPLRTEMAYELEGDPENTINAFIVGFSTERLEFKPYKLKFLSGLAIAIFVAAFDLNEDEPEDHDDRGKELDVKEFVPARPHQSSLNLAVLGNHIPFVEIHHTSQGDDAVGLDLEEHHPHHDTAPITMTPVQPFDNNAESAMVVDNNRAMDSPHSLAPLPSSEAMDVTNKSDDMLSESHKPRAKSIGSSVDGMSVLKSRPSISSNVPTWEPASSFAYPIADIPIKHPLIDTLTFESFAEVKHIADGSNSNIFIGRLQGEKVIIKMIKAQVEHDPVAMQEFDLEYGTLARISHPHIIKVYGTGFIPRRFIVLEWLGGGSLNTILLQNQVNSGGLTQKFFKKPTFSYMNLLQNARAMAEGLDYLHHRSHPGATFIHRDLKPDNVGYTKDGCLKLFDFGLVTCVRSRTRTDEAYEMTGYTGSLRYMAPEVVLRKPYCEKADVYSFGIMLWQMARDRVPFKGLSKDEFIKQVVHANERPKLDKTWPPGFTNLLKQCWEADPNLRPSISIVLMELNKLIGEEGGEVNKDKPRKGRVISGSEKANFSTSSWF